MNFSKTMALPLSCVTQLAAVGPGDLPCVQVADNTHPHNAESNLVHGTAPVCVGPGRAVAASVVRNPDRNRYHVCRGVC